MRNAGSWQDGFDSLTGLWFVNGFTALVKLAERLEELELLSLAGGWTSESDDTSVRRFWLLCSIRSPAIVFGE